MRLSAEPQALPPGAGGYRRNRDGGNLAAETRFIAKDECHERPEEDQEATRERTRRAPATPRPPGRRGGYGTYSSADRGRAMSRHDGSLRRDDLSLFAGLPRRIHERPG